MKQFLFAYGTLIPDLAPLELRNPLRGLSFVGEGSIRGRLYDLGDYPAGAMPNARVRRKISGKVFELKNSESLLPFLDDKEGYRKDDPSHSLFVRKRSEVRLESGGSVRAWVYVYQGNSDGSAEIRIGRWDANRRGL